MAEVTKDKYPRIWDSLNCMMLHAYPMDPIDGDSCEAFHNGMWDARGLTHQDLQNIEAALVALPDKEFQDFSTGEDDITQHLRNRSDELRLADNLLEAFFFGEGVDRMK